MQVAADILAKEVHAEFSDKDASVLLGDAFNELQDDSEESEDFSDLGIWIDPIGKQWLDSNRFSILPFYFTQIIK